MPKVYNKYQNPPADAIYVGRPSKWGNSYSHKEDTTALYKVASRDEAVDKYEADVMSNPTMIAEIKSELKGKDLVCWCKPARCHGDVLLRIANEDTEEKEEL